MSIVLITALTSNLSNSATLFNTAKNCAVVFTGSKGT
jgi:hypothetical protein